MVVLAPTVDPRHAAILHQRRIQALKDVGAMLAGLAGFVWALKVLMGQR